MIAGHKKFESNWHFGVLKLKWRNSNVETLTEIIDADDVMSQYLFYQRYPFKNNKKMYLIKRKKTCLSIFSGSRISL